MTRQITDDLVDLVFKLVTTVTDSEMIAVRLRQGKAYPFYKSSGYAEPKVGEECLFRPETSDVNYEDCMCGRVINEDRRGFEEFFTKYGTFWNSNIGKEYVERLDKAFVHDRSCFTEGIKSLAIVPLKHEEKCEGLFHIADLKTDKFNPGNIQKIEEIGI